MVQCKIDYKYEQTVWDVNLLANICPNQLELETFLEAAEIEFILVLEGKNKLLWSANSCKIC